MFLFLLSGAKTYPNSHITDYRDRADRSALDGSARTSLEGG